MGSRWFEEMSAGRDATEAFDKVVLEAEEEHGQDGYSGTIAEKWKFEVVIPDSGESWRECVDRLHEHGDFGKWDPARCILIDSKETDDGRVNRYVFFGWASSSAFV